jgi:hypothetical protein
MKRFFVFLRGQLASLKLFFVYEYVPMERGFGFDEPDLLHVL